MMRKLHRQGGMTAIGWLLVLGLIAFFVLIALRLIPVYLEYIKVVTVLESLEEEPGIGQKTRTEILQLIERRLDINDVRHVDPRKRTQITKDDGRVTIRIRYERREPLIGNVDVVASFDKAVQVAAR